MIPEAIAAQVTIAAASRPGLPTLRAWPAPRPLSDAPRMLLPSNPALSHIEEWPDGRLGIVIAGRAAPLDSFDDGEQLDEWLMAQVDAEPS